MSQRIDVPGMGIVEFPDGMTDDQIAAAIRANSPQPSGAEQLAKQTGAGEAFLVGAGAKTNDILNGLTQLYLKATGDEKALGGLKTNVEEAKSLYAPLAKERPISTGIGGALPAMAVPGAGASYGGAALAAAVPELLSYGTAQERLGKGAVSAAGGVAGRAIGAGITNLLKPAGVGVNANQAAMEAAGRIGYKPLAGQATQNPALMNVENYLARTPGSSGTMQALLRGNQKAVNRAAAGSIGQSSDDLSASVLNAAEKAIGADYQRLQAVTAPQLGDDFVNSLIKIEQSNAARSAFRDPQIDSLLEKAMDLASKGNLSGTAYKEIRTELSGQATKAFKGGDATLGQAVKGVRDALDDAAEKSLSKADQEAWRIAREQWGNWKTLTKGLVAEAGDVSPARVAAQLRNQPGFRTGNLQGPLADVARIGEGIKGAINPNSGSLAQGMLYGNPITGVPLAASNYIGAQVYTNPVIQKYLREGLLDIGQNGELIVKATGIPLGVAGTQSLLGVQ